MARETTGEINPNQNHGEVQVMATGGSIANQNANGENHHCADCDQSIACKDSNRERTAEQSSVVCSAVL